MRVATKVTLSIKTIKGIDTAEPLLTITTRDKSDDSKVRGSWITLNRQALKLLGLQGKETVTETIDKVINLSTAFAKGLEPTESETDKEKSIAISFTDFGYSVYNTTDLTEDELPVKQRSKLTVKHTAKLTLKECDLIFKHYGLTFGNSYNFKLEAFEMPLTDEKNVIAYSFEQAELIKEVVEAEKPIKKVRSALQLANDAKISKYFADEIEAGRKGTLKAYWILYPAPVKPVKAKKVVTAKK